jgi:RNA polymerase sigma factor (sigma-70 family)
VTVTSDEELMAAYVGGDTAAFEQLFRRYAPLLQRVLGVGLPSMSEAEDLVQQTFLQVHRARRDFDQRLLFRPWVFTIALNLKRESFRTRKRRPEAPFDELAASVPVTGSADGRTNAVRALAGPLNRLPADQREVIALHWLGGMTFPEIARVVGATTGAAKLRAHRGYVALRSMLGVERDGADDSASNPHPSTGIRSTAEPMSVDRGLR